MTKLLNLSLIAFALIFGLNAGTISAQEAETPSSRLSIEEIVVTGTKRDIGQQDAAVAVSALTEQSFRNTFATELITEFIPGAGPPPHKIKTDFLFSDIFFMLYKKGLFLSSNSSRSITSH